MRGLSLHRVGWRRASLPRPQRRCESLLVHSSKTNEDVQLKGLTPKWQSLWGDSPLSNRKPPHSTNKTAYVLPMFPYPSGTLHLGHLRVYTISDVLARFKQMQGYDVLHPIGWDAFGLPAENAAIERGVHPADWTLRNIEAMKTQMMEMGGRWSWDKEFRTCDPSFYKHTQRLFLMLHERGLAYQAKSLVNWDPVDQTVLANEQVDDNGCSWRSGAKVEQKMLKQWFLKIKEFQEPLLKDLDALAEDGRWPERVLAMQRNWIGQSKGTKLCFEVKSSKDPDRARTQETHEEISNAGSLPQFEPLEVYTTRVDTLFGVAYIALSMNHPIVQAIAKTDMSLKRFLEDAKNLPPDSKQGRALQGVKARNPIAGLVKDESVPEWVDIWVAPYVLDDYGSGAVMGVPAHDARDYAHWQETRAVPVTHVISLDQNVNIKDLNERLANDRPVLEKGYLASSDGDFRGLSSDEASEKIIQRLELAGRPVKRTTNWRLRDWLISRQRYWGTPIPIIHCDSCGPVAVPETSLPIELPNLPASYFQGKTGNPLAEDEDWKKTTCPECHGPAERETDTMDTFMDSSWYFFRFLDPMNVQLPMDPQKTNAGMPVDVYIGGVEHAILHLLYARFISKFLATTSLWPEGKQVNGEPFKRLITQGMVHGKTYSDPATGRFLKPDEIDMKIPSVPVIKGTNVAPKVSYEKMSKSKYNGVDPGATIAHYGADATRAHMLFQAPVSDVLEWDEKKIAGVQRWLTRVLKLSTAFWYPAGALSNFVPPHDIDLRLADYLTFLRQAKTLGLIPAAKYKSSPYRTKEQELISALKSEEMELLSKLQETIASVTKSYSETYSLNTVVSDLMTLTNSIWDTPHVAYSTPAFKWLATVHLLRMIAPIAPGVAEEGWHTLHGITNHIERSDIEHPLQHYGKHKVASKYNKAPSIFTFGFPTADLDILPLLNPTITCVVQFNGRKKFDAEIKKLPAAIAQENNEQDMAQFVLGELSQTEAGQKYFARETGAVWKASTTQDSHQVYNVIPADWTVKVAKKGAIINLVDSHWARKGRPKKAE